MKSLEIGVIGIVAEASQFDPEKALELWESTKLNGDDFESVGLGSLWNLIGDFVRAGMAADVVALTEKVKALKPRGLSTKILTETLLVPPPSRHILAEYARIIADTALKRRADKLLSTAVMEIETSKKSTVEIVNDVNENIQALTNRVPSLCTSEGDVLAVYKAAEDALNQKRTLCIPSGIEALDAEIGGLQASVLTMVGAYPGVGKSALLASMLLSLGERGIKVGFFSLEDERTWIARRMLASASGVSVFKLATGKINEKEFMALAEHQSLIQATLENIVIDDRPGLTPTDIIAAARDMVLNHKCQVIMLDHLGEVRLQRSERYDLDVADALSGLRDIAKRFKIPVIVASHVRRRMGLTVDDAPHLTDFANSSAPERMARVALGLSKVPGGIRCSVLKATNGPAGAEIGLPLIEYAAMVQLDGRLHLGENK